MTLPAASEMKVDPAPVPAWLLIIAVVALGGLVALTCFGILLTTWLLNRGGDPRHANRPSDPP